MKFIIIGAGAIVLALSAISSAIAGPASGTTELLGPALEDTPVDVDVSINTNAPVVPYEYSIINQCWFDGTYSGHWDSYERFDLAGPWFQIGGVPHTTVTINEQLIPAGAVCKVYIVKNNTTVKGSLTKYEVEAAP